jgi:PAS domain S-box-containing protein
MANSKQQAPASSSQIHSEEVLRRLVDSVADYAIFMLNPDGTIATWNLGAERLKGYTAQQAIGRHFSMFYPASANDAGWPAEELRLAQEKGRFEDEGWRLRQDGTRFWANVVITAIRDEQGQLIGFSKVTRDLTERREQENRTRESERNLRLLIEGVQDYAIFRLNAQGYITSWNLGAQRIKGYAANEVIGQHFSIFYQADAVASGWPKEELRRATALGRFEDEGWRVRKDGTLLWANVVITAIRDEHDELIGFSKVTRDLTERRRHEQMLVDSEEKLRLVVEGVRDHAMFLLDAQGRVASWNAGAQRVLGFAAEDIVGHPSDRLYTDDDSNAGKPQAELMAALHAGYFEADGWRRRADGSPLWTRVMITPLHDRQGQLSGHVQIVRDLSERMRVEELESEGQRIHQFIAMLSHELRNPLAPISHAVHILQGSPHQTPELARCAQMISRQADHLTRLVDDLLDVSRITNGKIQVQPAPLDLAPLLAQAVEGVHSLVTGLGHTLSLDIGTQPVPVIGDTTRLTQAITNLLSNAAKYTPQGGSIRVSLRRQTAVATLQVTDDGIGMSEALMQHAFEPFVQGSRSLDRSMGGLGIGLTLVKRIVGLHGGSVAVSSAGTNKGTQFTVTLPLTEQPIAAAPTATAPHVTHDSKGLRVLVVDDNEDAAVSLAELLRLSGHQVAVAHDGPDALRLAGDLPPDIVLLDLGLPGMDGYEVARHLRAQPALRDTRLVALSGYGQESDKRATAQAGFEAHLVKPVALDELMRLLASQPGA